MSPKFVKSQTQIHPDWRSNKSLPQGWKVTDIIKGIQEGIRNLPEEWRMRNGDQEGWNMRIGGKDIPEGWKTRVEEQSLLRTGQD